MNITIRLAKPEEVKSAFALALRVFMEFEAPQYTEEALSKFTKECSNPIESMEKNLLFCAFDENRVVGMIRERGNGHIQMVFVDPAYHRKGIATAMLERMIVALKLQGFDKITLHSSPYGIPFYHHFGFRDSDGEQSKDGFIFTPMAYEPKELWDVYDKERNETGKVVERGRTMTQEEYHIVVHVWIQNSDGNWLLSKRTPNKTHPNLWECAGGSATIGENSVTAAIREAKEELNVSLDAKDGSLWNHFIKQTNDFPQHLDVWVFHHDCPIDQITLQEGETCDAMWASTDQIRELIEQKKFVPLLYRDEFFGVK